VDGRRALLHPVAKGTAFVFAQPATRRFGQGSGRFDPRINNGTGAATLGRDFGFRRPVGAVGTG
jgi:hypothetical protein